MEGGSRQIRGRSGASVRRGVEQALGDEEVTTSSSSSIEEENEEYDRAEEEDAIMEELSEIPFDVLQKIREDGSSLARVPKRGKAGLKRRAGGHRDTGRGQSGEKNGGGGLSTKLSKKRGKHMPKEMSSKRPARPSAGEMGKRGVRDPRFDSLSGDASKSQFRKNYGFVFDEVIPKEVQELKRSLKKAKGEAAQKRIKLEIKALQHKASKANSDAKREKRERELKSGVSRASSVGQKKRGSADKPKYYLKKSEIKRQLLLDKYNELRKSGKLDDFLAKKRRRNAAKDHVHVPFGRR